MEEGLWFCGSCGVVIGIDDFEDMDDLHCPECDSPDIAHSGDEDRGDD